MDSHHNSPKVKSLIQPFKPIILLLKTEAYFHVNNAEILLSIFFIQKRKIIETYDGNGDGICESIEVAKWLVDCYRAMNKQFQPTATDIASYVQIIDKNRNGKVNR